MQTMINWFFAPKCRDPECQQKAFSFKPLTELDHVDHGGTVGHFYKNA